MFNTSPTCCLHPSSLIVISAHTAAITPTSERQQKSYQMMQQNKKNTGTQCKACWEFLCTLPSRGFSVVSLSLCNAKLMECEGFSSSSGRSCCNTYGTGFRTVTGRESARAVLTADRVFLDQMSTRSLGIGNGSQRDLVHGSCHDECFGNQCLRTEEKSTDPTLVLVSFFKA